MDHSNVNRRKKFAAPSSRGAASENNENFDIFVVVFLAFFIGTAFLMENEEDSRKKFSFQMLPFLPNSRTV